MRIKRRPLRVRCATALLVGAAVMVALAQSPSASALRTAARPVALNAVAAACAGRLVSANAGTVAGGRLKEISGIDVGVVNPSRYWVHNDSGDSARIFALSPSGATRAVYTLSGAKAVDWEDIAVGGGPAAGVSYVYVADIGDNALSRAEIVVYRVREPKVGTRYGTFALSGVAALRLRYPDGAHNAEALVVDPRTGALVIIEKTSAGGDARVYSAPAGLRAGSLTTLRPGGQTGTSGGLLERGHRCRPLRRRHAAGRANLHPGAALEQSPGRVALGAFRKTAVHGADTDGATGRGGCLSCERSRVCHRERGCEPVLHTAIRFLRSAGNRLPADRLFRRPPQETRRRARLLRSCRFLRVVRGPLGHARGDAGALRARLQNWPGLIWTSQARARPRLDVVAAVGLAAWVGHPRGSP